VGYTGVERTWTVPFGFDMRHDGLDQISGLVGWVSGGRLRVADKGNGEESLRISLSFHVDSFCALGFLGFFFLILSGKFTTLFFFTTYECRKCVGILHGDGK
jgi:hypothetical protein